MRAHAVVTIVCMGGVVAALLAGGSRTRMLVLVLVQRWAIRYCSEHHLLMVVFVTVAVNLEKEYRVQ